MTMFRAISLLCIVGVVGTFAHPASAAQRKPSIPPAMSEPLSSQELFNLYSNRSWIWKDGAGYFANRQREFKSWTADGGGSYGLGRWFITDPGKLCFKAVWHAKGGSAPALTCFSHRKKGNAVFQKREPDGDWYQFKTTPARVDDEYRKVRPGDYVYNPNESDKSTKISRSS